jgi:hypothetical protein
MGNQAVPHLDLAYLALSQLITKSIYIVSSFFLMNCNEQHHTQSSRLSHNRLLCTLATKCPSHFLRWVVSTII